MINNFLQTQNKSIVTTAGFAPALTLHLSGSTSALPCRSRVSALVVMEKNRQPLGWQFIVFKN